MSRTLPVTLWMTAGATVGWIMATFMGMAEMETGFLAHVAAGMGGAYLGGRLSYLTPIWEQASTPEEDFSLFDSSIWAISGAILLPLLLQIVW